MVKVREDMTGWKMWEHGVPDSRLIVLKQVEDYVDPHGNHRAQWLCECNCKEHRQIIVLQAHLRNGDTQSCGCLQKENTIVSHKKNNPHTLFENYGILWLTNTNNECYFDLEDAEQILNHCWYEDVYGYAVTNIHTNQNKRTVVHMHTFLGYFNPDHNNRNKLDNRKFNLVPCTQKENTKNRTIASNNTSGFIGVGWKKQNKKWYASITVDGTRIHLGYFLNKDDAIRARLMAESKYYHEFAPQRHLYEQYRIDDAEVC